MSFRARDTCSKRGCGGWEKQDGPDIEFGVSSRERRQMLTSHKSRACGRRSRQPGPDSECGGVTLRSFSEFAGRLKRKTESGGVARSKRVSVGPPSAKRAAFAAPCTFATMVRRCVYGCLAAKRGMQASLFSMRAPHMAPARFGSCSATNRTPRRPLSSTPSSRLRAHPGVLRARSNAPRS